MRTTVDLPTPLFRRAKARAAERGETLRQLFTRAVETEIGKGEAGGAPKRARMKLPLFGDPNGPKVSVSNADIEAILVSEDAASTRPRRRR